MSDPVWALPESVGTNSEGLPSLLGGLCPSCSLKLYPRPAVCPRCWSKDVATAALARRGTLYTYTIVHAGRPGWQTPYAIAYVDLEDGVRVCGPLDLDAGEPPAIGSTVELTTGMLRIDEKGVSHLSHRFRATSTEDTR